MTGYEELTPNQLIYIVNIIFYSIIIMSSSIIIRSVLNFFTARIIKFNIEKNIINEIIDKVELKKSLFSQIIFWWKNRKKKKESDSFEKYVIKPIEEVKYE